MQSNFDFIAHLFQTDRIRKAAAIKIQRYYRGYSTRQRHKQRLRSEFDVIRSSYKKPSKAITAQDALETKKLLISQLLAFFEVQHDGDRIVSNIPIISYLILIINQ